MKSAFPWLASTPTTTQMVAFLACILSASPVPAIPYEIELPHGSLSTGYGAGLIAGVPLYYRLGYSSAEGFTTRFNARIRAEIDPVERTITFPEMTFTVEQALVSEGVVTREVGFGQRESFTIRQVVQPFSVSFAWQETSALKSSYRFPTWKKPATVSSEADIVVEYTITGPSESVSRTVVLRVPDHCLFVNNFNYSSDEGYLNLTDYPERVGVTFAGAYHYFDVTLIGESSVHETVDGQEFTMDLSRLWIGPNGYGMVLQKAAEATFITTTAQPRIAGTVTGGGAAELGETLRIEATPHPGYVFAGWSAPFESEPNPFFAEANADFTITAKFEPDLADDDGDLLSNYDEIVIWKTRPDLADTDGDGIPDGMEVRFGLDPTVADTELLDYLREHAVDLSLLPAAGTIQLMADGRLVTWGSPATVTYQLKQLTSEGAWESVGTPIEWPVPNSENLLIFLEAQLRLETEANATDP